MADGDCNCYGCCSNVKESLHFPCNCSESQFKYWNKVFAEDTVPAFKLIGIGIVPGMHDNVNGIPHDSIELSTLIIFSCKKYIVLILGDCEWTPWNT